MNGTAYPSVSWYRRALSTSLCSRHGRMAQKVILEHEASPCANFSSLDASLPYLQFISPLRLFFSQSRPKPYEQNICAEPFSLYIITSQPAFFRMVRSIRVVYFGKALPSPLRNRPLPIPNLRANQPPPPLACINNSGKDPRGWWNYWEGAVEGEKQAKGRCEGRKRRLAEDGSRSSLDILGKRRTNGFRSSIDRSFEVRESYCY